MNKKEMDRIRKREILYSLKEHGLRVVKIIIKESDYEVVMKFKQPNPSPLKRGRKTK